MAKSIKNPVHDVSANQNPELSPAAELVTEENPLKNHPIAKAFEHFLARIHDLQEAVKLALPSVARKYIDELEKHHKKYERFIQIDPEGGEAKAVAKGAHAGSDLLNTVKELDRLSNSKVIQVLERSLFIGIFSEYDVFVGNLLQAIYSKKPDLFKGIRREITLSDLLEFESVDAVKQDILDKEIDAFRRNSYVEQFAELEKKFEIRTLTDFKEWATFIELSQRRNLMTHNGGHCSEQYLIVCDREGYKFSERPKIREELKLGPNYILEALLIIAKVAFMLTHTLWRKVLPHEGSVADTAMNTTIYNLLEDKKWKYAAEFGQFGLAEPLLRSASDMDKRLRVINASIAMRQCKDKERSIALLNAMDWSASLRDFQLALAVLKEEYVEASRLMRNIGKRGELVDQIAYHNWPLFHDFRDREEFQKAYEDVYKIPFIEKITEEAQANAESTESRTNQIKQVTDELIDRPATASRPEADAGDRKKASTHRRSRAKKATTDSNSEL